MTLSSLRLDSTRFDAVGETLPFSDQSADCDTKWPGALAGVAESLSFLSNHATFPQQLGTDGFGSKASERSRKNSLAAGA
jgi:hypothetical protein